MVKAVLNVFLLLSALWGVLIYDISSHGSLESSRTGRVLKDANLLIYVKPYYSVVEKNVVTWYKWSKKNFPHKEYQVYKNKTLEATKNFGETVVRVSKDATIVVKKYSLLSYNYIVSKIPPDFTEKALKFFSGVYEFTFKYAQIAVKYVQETSSKSIKWLLENVSKDAFTWENMEKVYFETTRKIGIVYSDFTAWVGRKVECLLSA